MIFMARLATTTDVFNAIAEPQRRAILTLLIHGEQSVNEIANTLAFKQPQTSKHLRVLSEVELVHVRKEGKQRLYSLQSEALKPVFTWLMSFERLWQERFDQLDDYLKILQQEELTNEQQNTNT
jgi:DNA-binding transcriptional ArsR family regulator